MLDGYRVLDLTDGRGAFAGALLAMLGAEVVLVEPPGGLESRHRPPFIDDRAGPERSLVHHSFNRGKRSIIVDLTEDRGQQRLTELVAGADVLLDSGGPAQRRGRHHPGSEWLTSINPALIHGIVSPFGSTGPKADWAASDLVVAAAGAQLSLTGNPGRPPLRTAVPQVWLHGSADLALGVLLALQERARSGLGQVVDVSAQHSWTEAGFHYPLFATWGEEDPVRNGSHVRIGPVGSTFDFPAKDGHITMTLLFGAAVGPFTGRFVEWMAEEGACDAAWAEIDFTNYIPGDDIAHYEALKQAITDFTSAKTKDELYRAARDRRLLVAPVQTLDEVLNQEHFAERSAFHAVHLGGESSDGSTPNGSTPNCDTADGVRPMVVRAPGPLAKARPTPLPTMTTAPRLGADNATLPARPPLQLTVDAPPPGTRALDGLKVLDLTISFAGPIIGRTLAAHGATVIKVESQQRPDLTRTAGIFVNGDTIDHSCCFAHYNANKLSLGMNLRRDGAGAVLADLVRWADVLVDSFAPGALDRMGLDAETRRELNPDLITLSSSLLGQDGPLSELAGYGNMAAALCGFFATTGWPDATPVGPMGAYTDIISPRFAAAAIVAALDHRRRTGDGTYFDFGQGESCLQLLTLGLLDGQVNGRSWERIGNDDPFNAPHGVYPAMGDDDWVAIAVQSEEQWRALAEVANLQPMIDWDRGRRLSQRHQLDAAIEAWTETNSAAEIEAGLQAVGVAAHRVQNGSHCREDPQLQHRAWTTEIDHDRIGRLHIGTTPVQLSRTPARFDTPGPPLGSDSFAVLSELLGYDGEQIAKLAIDEVLE